MSANNEKPTTQPENGHVELSRRGFVQSAAMLGAGLMINPAVWAQEAAERQGSKDQLSIAMIGVGSQGRNLLNNCLKIEGVKFVAICDIWGYHQKYAANILKKYDQPVNTYTEYQEMLAKEKNIDAVIVASADWMHAEHSIACLKAGKNVYCEKEMANNLENCKAMVLAARESKKLLQIGHQRRSNPRYWHAMKLIEKDKVLGKITHCNGQWNRVRIEEQGWPKGEEMADDLLKKYGYDSMDRFRNWRWFKKFSGGAMADLGSHQMDVFSWFLKTNPKSVMASGGADYYPGREWYDNVMSIYEYATPTGPVRAFYQVLNTTSHGGFFETFMGTEGSMVVSEDSRVGQLYREVAATKREWENESEKIEAMGRDAITLKIGETLDPSGKRTAEGERLLAEAAKPVHQLHLENFFNAIRTGTPLSCPPEIAYETAVTVLRANDAVESGKRYDFKPEEFKA